MTSWGNRYSALFQEPPTVKSSPTLSNNLPDSFSANQAPDYTPTQSTMPSRPKYPPDSSVFVASLPNSIPPHEIQQKLAELICRFVNPLNVKIINDKMGNKAAFVQTKSNDDANLLINSQLYLDGKILRLELARAHRTLVLSFKDTELPPPKLRIIRNFAGYLRVIVDEKTPVEGWTPVRQDDHFSGAGYLFPYFAYSESSLRKLCELLGPLEEFKQIDLDSPPTTDRVEAKDPSMWLPHVLLSQDSSAESGIWEVKWQTREDAMQAKSIVASLPFVTWTWAHAMAQTDSHSRSDYRNIRPHSGVPHFDKIRFAGNHPPFQHGLNIKGPQDPLGLSGKDTRVPTRQSLKLNIEEFPPLTTGQHPLTPGKLHGKHERTISEDTETPITPESLHHTSPEIANMSGEDRDVDSSVPGVIFDKPAASPQPDATSFDESGFSYDRATLYIAGIPKSAKESQIRELFGGYGQIKNVALFPNPRGEFFSAFIGFYNDENAANAMQAANGAHPAILGCTKLRVRYKRAQIGGRYARRGRFPAHSIGQNGADRQPKQKSQPKAEESNQVHSSDGLDESRSGTQGGEKSASSAEDQAAPSSGDVKIKDDLAKSCDAGDASGSSMDVNANNQHPNEGSPRQSSAVPTSKVVKDAATSVVEATPSVNGPSPPKPYYGYYAPQFPANYHQPWAYPYPMYGPVYPYQSYGHPYWYPPGMMPVPPAAYASPLTPGNKMETGRMGSSASPTYGAADYPPFGPTKPPVAPAASYQNPDGGITYVYPTEVIEKYMTKPQESDAIDSRNGAERSQKNTPQSSTQPYLSTGQYSHGTPHLPTSYPSPLRFRHPPVTPDSNSAYDVHPSIASAVYRNYAPLPPPPVDKMPQGSFVFNPQGVVQHIEPAAYAQGGQMNGHASNASEVGIGLVQAAAAVVANGYHQTPPYPSPMGLSIHGQDGHSDVQSGSSRYPSPIPIPGPYYYPQNMYHPTLAQMGPGTHAYHEPPTAGASGSRGGYRRRASHVTTSDACR